MKIVVLDGDSLNRGDLSWDKLKKLGSCEIYPRTGAEEVFSRAVGADVLLVNKVPVSAEVISQLPSLRYIGVMATGYNVIDVKAAREQGIAVTNVPTYGTASVAQMVFAHLLNLTQRVAHHHHTVVEGRWAASPDFCYWDYPLVELNNLAMGIVGMGNIGTTVAHIAQAFGMRIFFNTLQTQKVFFVGMQPVNLDTLFRTCDVISLHCPLTPDTHHLVDRRRLSLMKSSALLINTSRGPLIDEAALREALLNRKIAGAGLDVLETEPPAADHPLYSVPNCVITPHIAWATRASRQRLMDQIIANLKAFVDGDPRNVVD